MRDPSPQALAECYRALGAKRRADGPEAIPDEPVRLTQSRHAPSHHQRAPSTEASWDELVKASTATGYPGTFRGGSVAQGGLHRHVCDRTHRELGLEHDIDIVRRHRRRCAGKHIDNRPPQPPVAKPTPRIHWRPGRRGA